MSAIECFTSSTATTIDMALLDKEAGDAALNYSIGLDLQKENDALKQRIKRLEEAGDGLLELCEAEVNQHNLADEIDARCKSWRKAKESKL